MRPPDQCHCRVLLPGVPYHIHDFLLEYDEDNTDCEITIHLPQAATVKYNLLWQEHQTA